MMVKKLGLLFLLFSVLIIPASLHAQTNNDHFTDETTGAEYIVELYIPANFPVAMAITEEGRLFYTEKTTGDVRLVSPLGELQREPVIHVDVDGLVERGLLGIELDPDYEENGVIWISYTSAGTARDWPANTIARFIEKDGVGSDLEIMMQIPIDNGQLLHNGGNLRFDRDGLLYWSVGDYGEASNAQDLTRPQGKIHRFEVTEDGLIPAKGNYLEGSLFAYGFRNPYDIALDPVSDQLWATENGPECDDEVNIVVNGFNYGWDVNYLCTQYALIRDLTDYMPPLISFDPTIGISGLTFYDSSFIPEWENDLFFCDWVWGTLHRVEIDDTRSRVVKYHPIDLGENVTCKLGLAVDSNGALYFGTVGVGTGGIYRISPAD